VTPNYTGWTPGAPERAFRRTRPESPELLSGHAVANAGRPPEDAGEQQVLPVRWRSLSRFQDDEGDASHVTTEDADVNAVARTASISASPSFGIYRFVFFQPRGSSGFLVNV